VRAAISGFDQEVKAIEKWAQVGYRGSVAAGTVGNPKKLHYGMEPDIRGECHVGFDIDGFMLSTEVYYRIRPDKTGKRWAARFGATRRLESLMRRDLEDRPELEHMKRGAAGFELLVRHATEIDKLRSKGPIVIIIT